MFSEEDVAQIGELTAELERERAALGDAGAFLFRKSRLHRFLQGNDGFVEAAAAQFRTMLRHREEAGLEGLRAAIEGKPWAPESAPVVSRFCSTMCGDIWQSTPEGDILMVTCDGRVSWDDVAAMEDGEIYTADNTMMELRQESLDARSEEQHRIAKVVQVRDLSGLGLASLVSNATMMHRLKTIVSASLTSYPETLRTVIILNAPSTFGTVWSIVSPLLDERVQAKVKFLELESVQDIIDVAGLAAVEILGRLRGRSALESIDIVAGDIAYGCYSLKAGQALDWTFTVVDMDIEFSLVFFPRSPGSASKPVVAAARVCGSQSGQYVADDAGFLWATWSNQHSWINPKTIAAISGFCVW